MKKLFTFILTVSVLCTSFMSCRRTEDADSDYLPVYLVGNDTLSDAEPLFNCRGLWKDEYGDDYQEESVPSSVTETVLGEEAELFYIKTIFVMGRRRRLYRTDDFKLEVCYDAETGKTVSMANSHIQSADAVDRYSEDEYRDSAVAFSETIYPQLKEYDYESKVTMRDGYAEVDIRLCYAGYKLNEWISVALTSDGQVSLFSKKMHFPDGIPQDVLSVIDNVDFEKCKSSVEHCFLESAAKNKDIMTESFGIFDYREIRLRTDGSLACIVYTSYTANGKECRTAFAVPFSRNNASFDDTNP